MATRDMLQVSEMELPISALFSSALKTSLAREKQKTIARTPEAVCTGCEHISTTTCIHNKKKEVCCLFLM